MNTSGLALESHLCFVQISAFNLVIVGKVWSASRLAEDAS